MIRWDLPNRSFCRPRNQIPHAGWNDARWSLIRCGWLRSVPPCAPHRSLYPVPESGKDNSVGLFRRLFKNTQRHQFLFGFYCRHSTSTAGSFLIWLRARCNHSSPRNTRHKLTLLANTQLCTRWQNVVDSRFQAIQFFLLGGYAQSQNCLEILVDDAGGTA